MSISLYQRYFDCLSADDDKLIGIYDNRSVVVACTQQKYIGYPFGEFSGKCIKTEIDSVPTEMDEINRKIINLQIEEAALKKETDELSKSRLEKIQQELSRFKSEYDSRRCIRKNKENWFR